MRVDITGRVTEDGQATLRVRTAGSGDSDFALRAAFGGITDADLPKALKDVAGAYGLQKGELTAARKGDARNLAEPFWLEIEFEYRMSFDPNTPWRFWLPTARLALPDEPAAGATDVDLSLWTDQEVHARLEVPEGLVARPPLPVSVTRDFASYASTYAAEKGLVTLERRLTVHATSLPASSFDGLAALRRAVESDYNQRFAVEPFAGAAKTVGSDADRLTRDASRKIDAREYFESEKLLRQALDLKPDHKSAWLELGRALHGQRRYQEAIEANDKQIALSAFHEWAWNNRGWSEWAAGKLDEAEASFRKQIEVDPLHTYAHTNLGNLLVQRRKWPEARAVLETTARLRPEDGPVHLQLAKATVETGAKAEALPLFDKAVSLAKTPWAWNDAAWYMVEHRLDLDVALGYARSAVSAVTAASNVAPPESMKPSARVARTSSVGAYWDTLGWIQFKRGDAAEAVRYLSAAWQVHQHPEVGEHLGRALERAGRRRDALLTYKAALSLPNPADSLAAAARALAKNPPPGTYAADGATLAAQARSHSISRPGDRVGVGEVFLAIDETGRVVEARDVAADVFKEPIASLIGTKLSMKAPDQAPLRIEVLARLTCPSRGAMCTLELHTSMPARTGDDR
jgi:tetratricopeptide (TPR) repeat protein